MLSYHNDTQPEWLAMLYDFFFEKLPAEENSQFAVDFLKAIPVGKNLEPVKWKFYIFLMNENIQIVENLTNTPDSLRIKALSFIQQVLNLYQNALTSGFIDEVKRKTARDAGVEANKTACDAKALWDARTDASCSARAAVLDDKVNAVRSAADWAVVAAGNATKDDTIRKYANELLDILKNHQ